MIDGSWWVRDEAGGGHGRLMVLAHRGGRPGPSAASHRQNTVAAFASAGRLGADGVELDVRRTADGELVVHHDPSIAGMGPIGGLRRGDLPDWVPTLAEALDACGPMVVDIELKNAPTEPGFDPDQQLASAVVALLQGRASPDASGSGGGQRWLVSSFWPDTVAAAVAVAPGEVTAGLLVPAGLDAGALVDRAKALGCRVLAPWWTEAGDPTVVDAAHRAGLAVAAWTVEGVQPLAAVMAAGVDLVITDDVTGTLEFRDAR